MLRKILIANRGEIACRVIRTARRMGIATVAIYSEADAHTLHVEQADDAYPVGPAAARDSYLRIDRIIDAALRSGAEAVHPGYGFLSENADFAEACATAGLIFIGPPPAAIRAMGSKAAAKSLMERAGVPLVPGYHGDAQDRATLAIAAERIGYPVLIKASAGGGGKGMRIVERAVELNAAIEGAKREALASFGDDHVLIERYLTRPRHIEIQVFADTQGATVSLFERDCSIQRRHQKVIEEAPAPGMTEDRRAAMGEAACAAACAVGYIGAGTVEFIAEGDAFYFMEMNTRLQVEHPVTEMVTGLDLVEWQFRVAAGEALPVPREGLHLRGHAIEARVYAEDPARDFLPSIGRLLHLRQPETGPCVRVDTGVRAGDSISPNYDPMIAKLIAWGDDREQAVQRLATALGQYEVVGVRTNLGLLRAIAAHPAFADAQLDTGFIGRHADALMPKPSNGITNNAVLAAGVMAHLTDRQSGIGDPNDPYSPWDVADAWRMNGDGYQDLLLDAAGSIAAVRLHPQADGSYRLDLPDASHRVEAEEQTSGIIRLRLDGVVHRMTVVRDDDALTVISNGANHALRVIDPLAPPRQDATGSDRVTAPIPARVVRVLVEPGETVARGTPLIVLEAMKMELVLSAPTDGTVESIRHAVDEMVEEGTELVTFASD